MERLFFLGITVGTALGCVVALAMLLASRGAASPWTPRRIAALAASAMGTAAGLAVAFAGDTALFAPWWRGHAAAFGSAQRSSARAWFVTIGLLIVLHYALIALAILRRQPRTAGRIAAWSVVAWFAVDSTSGLLTGGAFNVLLINVPAFALGMPVYVWLARAPTTR